jgi:ABC-type uncharacterized transport system substrate-binding protein
LAQPAKVLRIGWLSNDTSTNSPFFDAFRTGMRDLGYVEGRNLVIEARFAAGSAERLDQLAVELVQLNPQILVTQGGPATYPALRAKPTMPVVFGFSGDPVEGKIVQSYARPGGNSTGISYMSFELVGKRMEMLKEVMPGMKRVALIANPHHPGEQGELRVSTAAAKSLGLAIDYHEVRNEAELESALAAILKSNCDAIDAFPDAFTMRHGDKIAAFTAKSRIPAISGWAEFAQRGNLMSYGPNLRDSYRRLATYVDKIARGAKPADLPVELPTSVEMVVNLKTAKAIGISVPNSILVRADKVIE